MTQFRTEIGENIFRHKYARHKTETWAERSKTISETIGNGLLSRAEKEYLRECIESFKFLPGGRYIYYAGRLAKFYNNCYLLRAEEDTREEWANITWRAMSCLMTGGGIGIDYSRLRPSGRASRPLRHHPGLRQGGQDAGRRDLPSQPRAGAARGTKRRAI